MAMENEIIMNEEVMEGVIDPAVEVAESYCSSAPSAAKSSKALAAIGVTCIIGVVAAGAVIYMKKRRKSAEYDNAVKAADAPYIVEVDDDEEDEKD